MPHGSDMIAVLLRETVAAAEGSVVVVVVVEEEEPCEGSSQSVEWIGNVCGEVDAYMDDRYMMDDDR